eukprot:CAMPEP_0168464996 /NCGR_PEP_ID=MMETSP0228-20121227/55877_1 /TAXON_ID=133427 /ORGANISM="Protoceratium reticulatum, Strain CCCM 535 (=CCMP 1889)" /LENGTH=328 /DNA_ID=CAMNT_0008480537 /DNA_START=30 /DNA_END=1017 /DNA_ORIENTATION=+
MAMAPPDPQVPYNLHGFGCEALEFLIEGRLVPEVYLLGAAKSGTSSLASDLRWAGIASNAGLAKEFHFFDELARTHDEPQKASLTQEERALWYALHPSCFQDKPLVLADYTPDNLMMTPLPDTFRLDKLWAGDVPSMLSGLYGKKANKLTMLVLMREPLARYQSGWYWGHRENPNQTAPGAFAAGLREGLDGAKHGKVYTHRLWAGMYARHLESFLRFFRPDQFVIVPFKAYTQENAKDEVMTFLSLRLGIPLRFTREVSREIHMPHPTVEEDLPQEIISEFQQFMEPENERLFELLTSMANQSAFLANYHDPEVSVAGVKEWLTGGW